MTFSKALEHLKDGWKVSRSGWNGKGMYIYLEPKSGVMEAHIVMYTAEGKFQPGWLASQADLLADDWTVA